MDAKNAVALAGYVKTFGDHNGSVAGNLYLGISVLKSYDVAGCSALCEGTPLCSVFNNFVQRDPAINPAENCTSPASITNYMCSLWGSGIDIEMAANMGDWRGEFHVVVAGSCGFEKTNNTIPATLPGWEAPQKCGVDASGSLTGAMVHNHPCTCMGQKFFPGPYGPSVYAAFALAQNEVNEKLSGSKFHSMFSTYNPLKCEFFHAYMMVKNGVALGTCCSLFAQQYEGAAATYTPGWQGSDFWSVESSWSYSASAGAEASW